MAVMAVVSTASSLIAAKQGANAQRAAINDQLQVQYDNQAKQTQAQTNDRLMAARQEDSRIKVASGEAGMSLGSQSIEMALLNNQMSTGLASERVGLNKDIANQANLSEANQMMSKTATASALGAGLQIGLAGAQGALSGRNLKLSRAAASTAAAAKAG